MFREDKFDMVQRKSWTNSQNTKPLVRIYQKYFYLKSYYLSPEIFICFLITPDLQRVKRLIE